MAGDRCTAFQAAHVLMFITRMQSDHIPMQFKAKGCAEGFNDVKHFDPDRVQTVSE